MYMARKQVATNFIPNAGGALEIHLVPGSQLTQRGKSQGFLHGIEIEHAVFLACDGQAGSVDCHRGADGNAICLFCGEANGKSAEPGLCGDVFNGCNALDNACEHKPDLIQCGMGRLSGRCAKDSERAD